MTYAARGVRPFECQDHPGAPYSSHELIAAMERLATRGAALNMNLHRNYQCLPHALAVVEPFRAVAENWGIDVPWE